MLLLGIDSAFIIFALLGSHGLHAINLIDKFDALAHFKELP